MIIKIVGDKCPVFASYQNKYLKVSILLDTGSATSVYTKGVTALKDDFPNAEQTSLKTRMTGVTGFTPDSPIYIIPELYLGNIIIKNLPIAVTPSKDFPVDIILSSWVFSKNKFSIDFAKREIDIENYERPIYCGLVPEKLPNRFNGFFTFANVDDIAPNKSTQSLSKELKWCREHAPEAIKDLPDEELWDIMKGSYYATDGL